MKISTTILFASVCFGSTVLPWVHAIDSTPDIVVMGYNSYDAPLETLIFSSVKENENREVDGSDGNIKSIGLGSHLWTIDEYGPELKRGWMFRLRLTMQHVKDEYERRGKEDFVVVVADSIDVFVKESLDKNTLDQLNERFLTEFSDSKIVFSTQIYCCNPFELREFGRRDWDRYYDKRGDIPSMYKHLNAGTFMGYASALIDMSDEMKLWNTTYHRHEGFHSLAGLPSTKHLHMIDLEVDDDEWQLAAWFFQDQDKHNPISALDYHQDLFGVTGTFRAQEAEDNSYVVFSQDHFRSMFGEFPESFNPDRDMDKLVVCPFQYDELNMEFTNTITGGKPLVFHFAGNDWLCACSVFKASGFQNVPKKFKENCDNGYSQWYDSVQAGILEVALSDDVNKMLFLHSATPDSTAEDDVQEERILKEDVARELNPYIMKPGFKRDGRNPALRELNPYKMKRDGRELTGREVDPYGRENKIKRYLRSLAVREMNPYKMTRVIKRDGRDLAVRELKPY